MDSKKRHELETNDLREFLDNFKDFWDKNGNSILIALIVIVGGYAGYNWWNKSKITKANDSYQALADANTPKAFRGVAEQFPSVRDNALQRSGDDYLAEARDAAAAGEDQEKSEALDNAEAAYQAVVDGDATDLLKINAFLGLAAAAEMRVDWDKAKGFYDQAQELAGDRYTRLATIARQAKDKVDELRAPVAFGVDVPVLPPDTGLGPDLLPIDPVDPSDANGNGVPDRLERPEEQGETGATPGSNPLFDDNSPALPGSLGGDDPSEPPAIDPLLQPGGEAGE